METGGRKKLFSVLMLIIGCLFIKDPAMAQDSLEVWKVDYRFFREDSSSVATSPFDTFAKYGKASLYYHDGNYKLVFADSLYELGSQLKKQRYMVNGLRAEELLSPSQVMPDQWIVQDSLFFLWPKDYEGQWLGKSGEVAGLTYYHKVFSSTLLTNRQVLIYFTDELPEAAWKPYSFLHGAAHGILGIFLTNKGGRIIAGIEVEHVSRIKTDVDFFQLPKSLQVKELLRPPKLNE